MTIFFASRSLAREFKSTNGKFVDKGKEAPAGRRWGFQIHPTK